MPRTERHIDDDYLMTGTHKGADGATTLINRTADFSSCGAIAGLYIENVTQSENSLIVTATEEEITTTGTTSAEAFKVTDGGFNVTDGGGEAFNIVASTSMSWDNGDTYKIYKTGTKNSFISSDVVDASRGWKTDPKDMDKHGWKRVDTDIDRKNPGRVFAPNQPQMNR